MLPTVDTPWGKGVLLSRSRELAHVKPRGIQIMQRAPTSDASFRYEHPDEDDDPQEDRFVLRDTSLAGRIAEEVQKTFGILRLMFEIRVEAEQGIIQIWLVGLMNRLSYICHVAAVETDPHCRQVITGCNELLERYGLPRAGGYEPDRYNELLLEHRPWMRASDQVPGGNYTNKRV